MLPGARIAVHLSEVSELSGSRRPAVVTSSIVLVCLLVWVLFGRPSQIEPLATSAHAAHEFPGNESRLAAETDPSIERAQQNATRDEILLELRGECGGPVTSEVSVEDEAGGQLLCRRDGSLLRVDGQLGPCESVYVRAGDRPRVRVALGEAGHVDGQARIVSIPSDHLLEGMVWSEAAYFDPRDIDVVAVQTTGEGAASPQDVVTNAPRAHCSADGSFRIPCLDPSLEYHLLAGGNSWVSWRDPGVSMPVVSPTRTGVRVEMRRLFVALLDCRDQDAEPVRFASRGQYAGNKQLWSEMPGFRAQSDVMPEFLLAGLAPDALEVPQGYLLRMFIGLCPDERCGPHGISIETPGYDLRTERFWASSAARSEIETTPIAFHRTAIGWGRVVVAFQTPEGTATRDEDCPEGKLVLRSEAGGILQYGLPLHRSRIEITDVPAGRYEAVYVPRQGEGTFPPAGAEPIRLTVGEQAVTFAVSTATFARLVLELVDGGGQPYVGDFTFVLTSVTDQTDSAAKPQSGGRKIIRTLPRAPYELGPMTEGAYTLRCLHPLRLGAGTGSRADPLPIHVSAKGENRVRVEIQRP